MANTRRPVALADDEIEKPAPKTKTKPKAEEVEEVADETVDETVEEPTVDEDEDDGSFKDEDVPDDEELFEGGPNFGKLREWKEEFGADNIFVSVITHDDSEYCIWRTINRQEYRDVIKNLEKAIAQGDLSESDATFNSEEAITEICVLFPKYNRHDRKGTNAGFPKMISTDVMEQSGFSQVEVRKL